MDLTRRQRNQLFEAIREGGLSPTDFAFGYGVADGQTSINHRATTSAFVITEFGGYDVIWHVEDGPSLDYNADCNEWTDVLRSVAIWAEEIRYVITTPDLWKELEPVRAVLATVGEDQRGGTWFTPGEQAEIAERMEQAKEQARVTPDLTAPQLLAIEQAIDELKQSAEKVSRKDWRLLLYGQAMNLFFAYAVPPHVVQGIITTALTGLGHIFGLGSMPPALGPQA